MSVKPLWSSPPQFVDSNGDPYSGAYLFFYASGSSTKQNVYTDSTGNTACDNPITLNSSGYPSVSGTVVTPFGTTGLTYKIGLAIPGSADPPASFLWTADGISPINDTTVTVDQWVASGLTPTYVSATSFTLSGDQTSVFHVGRKLKTTNTGGTVYSRIVNSAYSASTTVTVENDSGTLDSGLSAVSYAMLSASNNSLPWPSDTGVAKWSADANGPSLKLVKSRAAAGYTVVQSGDDLGSIIAYGADGNSLEPAGQILFESDGTPGNSDMPGRITFSTTADGANTVTERLRIDSSGRVFINDSANANQTIGLTINQGASDNHLITGKSSDIAHGLTSAAAFALETDDYIAIQKTSGAAGGVDLVSVAESTAAVGMSIYAYAGTPTSTDITSTTGPLTFRYAAHDGANALVNAGSNENLATWHSWSAGAWTTRMLLKADDGELHLGNTTLVALDGEDDVMAVRGLQMVRTEGKGIAPTEYDRPAYSYDKLRELGIVGEKDRNGEFLIRVQPYLNLHDGALWQLYVKLQEQAKLIADQAKEISEMKTLMLESK